MSTAGILQGITLAPYLFVIVVNYLLRQSIDIFKSKGIDIMPNRSSREKNKYLTDLDYADNIALTATLLQDAQDLLSSLEDASAKVGLFLNAKKIDYMCINGDEFPAPILSWDGTQLKEVTDFKYLGSFVADSKKDFLTSKAQALEGLQQTTYYLAVRYIKKDQACLLQSLHRKYPPLWQ